MAGLMQSIKICIHKRKLHAISAIFVLHHHILSRVVKCLFTRSLCLTRNKKKTCEKQLSLYAFTHFFSCVIFIAMANKIRAVCADINSTVRKKKRYLRKPIQKKTLA
jgi:hypothetical protein